MALDLRSATLNLQGRAEFFSKLRKNKGYNRLATVLDVGRLARFEKSCWQHRCAAVMNDMKGARAKRALLQLKRLTRALGDPLWLEESIESALTDLGVDLEKLASRTGRGRPQDSIAKAFIRNMPAFIPLGRAGRRKTHRILSQEEIDDTLSDVFFVVFGRRISVESFTRLRKRHKVRE